MSPEPSSEPSALRAVVVGCGRIAGGFNEADESLALTHALSYRRLGIEIAGCCDLDVGRARGFAERWGAKRHGSRFQDVADAGPLVVSVCTPPEAQRDILRTVTAESGVRAVLLEKPLGGTKGDAEALAELAQAWGRPVLVNYFRAFTPFYAELERFLRDGGAGRVVGATVHYAGSLESHASHALERLVASFGAPVSAARLGGDATAPFFETAFLGGARALFVPVPSAYSIFELDLFAERGRVRVVDSERRSEAFVAHTDPVFSGYSSLVPGPAFVSPMTHEMIGSVEALLRSAGAQGDDGGSLARALHVTQALSIVAPRPL